MWRTALFVWFQIVRNISKRRTSSQTPRPESAGRTGSLAGSRNRLSAGGFLEFGLDALGDDLHAEGLSHVDDVVDDDAAARLRFVGEAKVEHVELQRFGADVAQRVE